MKTTAALLVLLTALCSAAPAQAQQTLRGEWRVEEVGGQAPPDGTTLTMTFADGGDATVTYVLAGDDPQSWPYTFTVEEGVLSLKPKQPFGEARSVEYDIRFEEGKLLLLMHEAEEEPDEETEEDAEEDPDAGSTDDEAPTGGDAGADGSDATGDSESDAEAAAEGDDSADADTDADDGDAEEAGAAEEEEEEEEEEDTREPVWVLVPAG